MHNLNLFQMPRFKKMVEDYKDKFNFLVVYVAEAHSTEGWNEVAFQTMASHKNEKERLAAARLLIETTSLKCNVAIDLMTNSAAKAYGATIDRVYIIKNGVVYFQGATGPFDYDLNELEKKMLELI